MFGSKLRSWMEAVRPRKKQQRKEKQQKSNLTNASATIVTNFNSITGSRSSENEILDDVDRKSMQTIASHAPRYSGANLSSPESAYSTGYSTDGTSPGAPPEYYINIRTGTRYFPSAQSDPEKCSSTYTNHILPRPSETSPLPPPAASPRAKLSPRRNLSPRGDRLSTVAVHLNGDRTTVSMTQDYENKNGQSRTNVTLHNNGNHSNEVSSRLADVVNSSITSPRQRNRIRTNPWVPGSNLSPGNSSAALYTRQDPPKPSLINSPGPTRYLSPTVPCTPINRSALCESLSSSSCSSLSATSLHWDPSLVRRSPRMHSGSEEEDDCTLNEMMGKYDESYVYEKETDILSDSDPTDCETDIDTGQDGGDEDEPLEREFDFIDNGSFPEYNADVKHERNTGHCTYHNFEMQRKTSRRRPTRRSQKFESGKQISEKRRRSTSSKKKHKSDLGTKGSDVLLDGSRSAGATPLSVRRMKEHPLSKLVTEDRLKKRSNSVSFSRDPVSTFDQRDKEADRKYKELIVEAEHILMSMKSNVQSPRRLPGPANKRVEMLRSTESSKPEAYIKNRLIEDISNLHLSRIPSSNFNSPRFSPKRNHITNFINNNSPVLVRRDVERTVLVEAKASPLLARKEQPPVKAANSPSLRNKHSKTEKRSPKYRKKISKAASLKRNESCSSESENDIQSKHLVVRNSRANEFNCPQSEPVKRKIYSNQCKAVAFNLNYESVCTSDIRGSSTFGSDENSNNTENSRQQVLLSTIVNLKRSLEDQSASLKQVYRSSQNIHL